MPTGGAVDEDDTSMDTTPCSNLETTNTCSTDEKVDMDTNEDSGTEEENEGDGDSNNSAEKPAVTGVKDRTEQEEDKSDTEKNTTPNVETSHRKLMDTNANDLDEMMDIGTVDQVEQEAQMKEEEEDSGSPSAPFIFNTVSVTEDSSMLPQPAEEDQSEDEKVAVELLQRSLSPSCKAPASPGGDSTSSAVVNGMKVVKLSLPELDNERSQPTQSSSTAVKPSLSPPLVKVKDEPVDEEYDQALTSSMSTADIKDEPNTAREDLKIGSVYSVTGNSTSTGIKMPAPPTLSPSVHMACFHCKKNLMKGQTAFQRKGCPNLFCSTLCLSVTITPKPASKTCHYCLKMIMRPQDVILAPVDAKGTVKDFCSQTCLSSFNYKRSVSTKTPLKPISSQSVCSMCSRYCVSKHEVILNSAVHKICSDACFVRFRTINNLTMASCGNCGIYCHNKPVMLKMEDGSKPMCGAPCLAKYKTKIKTPQPCTMCRTSQLMSDMVENKNNEDTVELFCTSSCVMAYKVQTVSASGALLTCDSCGKSTVPAYHLAMSDTSIRNFCTLPCVINFQEKFKKGQKPGNAASKAPVASIQIQTSTSTPSQPEAPKGPAKLPCFHCYRLITTKPELIQIKDKMVFVCGSDCSQEFKKANCVTSVCEYCKMEKVTKDIKRINNKDCHFCSDGCQLLYKHDLAKSWGKHCRCCAYCLSISKIMVTGQYGGTTEEFCSDDCRSNYTMLFCHVAKCDTCGCKKKLMQSLPILGKVKHFCDLNCLLHFCSDKTFTQGQVVTKASIASSLGSAGTLEATPVIANVVSLASAKNGQSNASTSTAKQGTASNVRTRVLAHAGSQTDAVKAPPPPPPKVLKNKALLCRPIVQHKGVGCEVQTTDSEAQTDDAFPKVIVLPVPVPVFIPLPMSMYSQYTPRPVGLPLPLPVPMFLPVTLDSAERIVETIQEIKEKIPSDPFEAELILMAEMVAEQDENNEKKESQKDRVVAKDRERPDAHAPDEHASNYSDDLDTDDLASFLNTWEDPSSDTSLKSANRSYAQEKLHPILDVPMACEPYSDPLPPAPPPMDIEADFSVETLEMMAKLREEAKRSPSPLAASPRRRQAHRKARDKKKGRKSQRVAEGAAAVTSLKALKSKDPPKLKNQYGIDAWKRWIQWRETQPNMEKPRFGSRPMELKEDVLNCTTAELSYGLCRFIAEVKRPNGEPYSPDSLFYLCLGIQEFLFQNGRVENIFTDLFYCKFSMEFTKLLKDFKPSITATGYVHSRVEEEYLWECKQLGAYSPIVLLNTLLFFCCKYFGFSTVEEHRRLSFAHVMRCTKTSPNNTKTTFLRFYPPIPTNESETQPQTDGVPAKKRKEEDSKEDILEMMENSENPLRCPVRLYEFYLSKCSESVKQRTNLFYLHPERCCIPNSPMWFSSTPLDDSTMEAMLIRILTVRELHLRPGKEGKGQQTPDDPPFIPDEEENSE
ncbi:zinc finger MYM-type protein 4-like [Diretmus argenteus]